MVASEARVRRLLASTLAPRFALVESAENTLKAEALLARCRFDLLISAFRLPETSVPDWAQRLRRRGDTTDVLFVANARDREQAVRAANDARYCLIFEPFAPEQLIVAARRCTTRRHARPDQDHAPYPIPGNRTNELIVGDCPQIRELRATIERVASRPSTLLVEGETGTGKEVAARAIHAASGRSGHFVPINCGALPSELLESELFGHAKGAFTGAHQARVGLIRHAHEGTLFLDEISEMPVPMQAKLLRVLEERTIRPVGLNQELPVDVRIVAATHRDLHQEVAEGRFREDLFYRLSVLVLKMPPLRERADDIPLLVRHVVARLAGDMGLPVPSDWDDELAMLGDHDWPGNVRELRNVIERSLLLGCPPSRCLNMRPNGGSCLPQHSDEGDWRLTTIEQRHIRAVLEATQGNKSEAARRLGISRKTLERKLKAWTCAAPQKPKSI